MGKSTTAVAGGTKRNHNGTTKSTEHWSSATHAARAEATLRKSQARIEEHQRKEQEQQQEEQNEQHELSSKEIVASSTVNNINAKDNDTYVRTIRRMKRTALLTHNTVEKRNDIRLQLHITKVQRAIDTIRIQLNKWDPIDEKQRNDNEQKKQQEIEEQERIDNENGGPIKKKRTGRHGPETWKLKGPARPAWEVYDFDTRYIDPHIKAHDDHKMKQQRSINILSFYKGKIGQLLQKHDEQEEQEQMNNNNKDIDEYIISIIIRQYLLLIMELGHLSYEKKQYKVCRSVWFESMELEGAVPMTNARECLIRLYIECHKYDAILRIYNEYPFLQNDLSSTWLLYSFALASYHVNYTNISSNSSSSTNKKDKKDDTNNITTATKELMVRAIRGNIFCAYYIIYNDTFQSVMEYTESLDVKEYDNNDDEPQSTFEEALEYIYYNEQYHTKLWNTKCKTNIDDNDNVSSSITKKQKPSDMLRDVLFEYIKSSSTTIDVEWDNKLNQIIKEYEIRKLASSQNNDEIDKNMEVADDSDDNDHSEEQEQMNDDDNNNETTENEESKGMIDDDDDDDDNDDDDDDDDDNQENSNSFDLIMYAGMFRTGMEMLQDDGLLPPTNS